MFLDQSTLLPSSNLPISIQSALAKSRKLIVLCNPQAAASKWVDLEIRFWLSQKSASDILLVRTGGELTWNGTRFVGGAASAAPPALGDSFDAEPFWLDLAWARTHADFGSDQRFANIVAQLAATILGLPLDEVAGDDVRSQRLLNLMRVGAITGLSLLTALSATLAVWAEANRREAVRQSEVALFRALSVSALSAVAGEPSLENARTASDYALAARRFGESPEAWAAASKALDYLPTTIFAGHDGVSNAEFAPSGARRIAVAFRQGRVVVTDEAGTPFWATRAKHDVAALAWSPSSRVVVAIGESGLATVFDATNGVARSEIRFTPSAIKAVAFIDEDTLAVVGTQGVATLRIGVGASTQNLAAPIDLAVTCGATFAWAQADGAVFRWSAETPSGRLAHRHAAQVTALECAQNGASIASLDRANTIRWTTPASASSATFSGASTIHLAPEGDRLAVATSVIAQSGLFQPSVSANQGLLFAERIDREPIWKIEFGFPSSAMAFANGVLLVADDRQALVRVNARDGLHERRFSYARQVEFLSGLAGGDTLVQAKDGVIEAVNLESGARRKLGRTPGWATSMRLNGTRGAALFLALENGADMSDQRRSAILSAMPGGWSSVALRTPSLGADFLSDGRILSISASGPGKSALYVTRARPYDARRIAELDGRFESIEGRLDGQRILLFGDDGAALMDGGGATVWRDRAWTSLPVFVAGGRAILLQSEAPVLISASDGAPIPTPFTAPEFGSLAISPDLRFASAVVDGRHELRAMAGGGVVHSAAVDSMRSAVFTGDASKWIVADDAGALHIVRLHGGATPLRVALPAALVGPLSTDATGAYLYAPLASGAARMNLTTGTIEVFKPAANISQIWPSPNGKGAIAEIREGGALAFDDKVKETGSVRLSGPLSVAAFSEDGRLAAIGSTDGGVRLLALATGQLIADIHPEIGSILNLSFAGQWLMIAGVNGAEAVAVDPIAALCTRIHRQMPQESWRRVGGGGKPPSPCRSELNSAQRRQAP